MRKLLRSANAAALCVCGSWRHQVKLGVQLRSKVRASGLGRSRAAHTRRSTPTSPGVVALLRSAWRPSWLMRPLCAGWVGLITCNGRQLLQHEASKGPYSHSGVWQACTLPQVADVLVSVCSGPGGLVCGRMHRWGRWRCEVAHGCAAPSQEGLHARSYTRCKQLWSRHVAPRRHVICIVARLQGWGDRARWGALNAPHCHRGTDPPPQNTN